MRANRCARAIAQSVPRAIVGMIAILLLSPMGCASVGPAVPKLSSEVGDRITEMRSLHEMAIRRMFDGDRQRVDSFLDQRWTPTFLRNYIGVSNIIPTIAARRTISEDRALEVSNALREYLADSTEASTAARAVTAAVETTRTTEPATIRHELDRFIEAGQLEAATEHVLSLLGTEDPARELLEWANQAVVQIEAERAACHAPIDEAESRVLGELGMAYDELLAAQNALTARVQAAARVKEIQDDALRGLGIKQSFDDAKHAALSVETGVGKALERLSTLEKNEQLQQTSLGRILRECLEPTPASGDSLKNEKGE